jgi:hypothetical protein
MVLKGFAGLTAGSCSQVDKLMKRSSVFVVVLNDFSDLSVQSALCLQRRPPIQISSCLWR